MTRSLVVAALLMIALGAAPPAPTVPAPASSPATPPAAVAASPFETAAAPSTASPSPIDQIVFKKLDELKITPANLCSDAVFVRRVYLDVTGTLPSAREARDFLLDRNPDKRRLLIDRLLQSEQFADYWAMKWADLLRIKAEFPINLWPNGAQAYHRWVRTCIKENWPYDAFVREMLTASGSNFRTPQVNFYRALQSKKPEGMAQVVALTFMGARTEHWPKERLAGMAAFFSQVGFKATGEWKEEIVLFDPEKAAAGPPAGAIFPDGTAAKFQPEQDPREVFANWLIDPKNPWFARNISNRLWSWLLGRGIIHEPDDIRDDNPARYPEVLAYLEKELVAARYDLKHVYRLILNSQVYQLSPIPRSKHPDAEANFAFYPLRRLEAEVLIDALCQITGTTEKYTSPIPEPFTFIPEDHRSISLSDGSITSSFLEMFGRPPRDTGWESERNNRPSPAQRLHLLNSSHIQRKIEQGKKLQAIIQGKGSVREIATELYLTFLSRFPTEDELKRTEKYAQSSDAKGREALIDLAWALANNEEFLHRH